MFPLTFNLFVYCIAQRKKKGQKCKQWFLFSSAILHRCTPNMIENRFSDVADQAKKITDLVGDDALENFAAEVKRSWREILYIILIGAG